MSCPALNSITAAQQNIVSLETVAELVLSSYTRVSGTTVTLTCNDGYELVGTTSTTCTSGSWSFSTKPYCRVPGTLGTGTDGLSDENKIIIGVCVAIAVLVIAALMAILCYVFCCRRQRYYDDRCRYRDNDYDKRVDREVVYVRDQEDRIRDDRRDVIYDREETSYKRDLAPPPPPPAVDREVVYVQGRDRYIDRERDDTSSSSSSSYTPPPRRETRVVEYVRPTPPTYVESTTHYKGEEREHKHKHHHHHHRHRCHYCDGGAQSDQGVLATVPIYDSRRVKKIQRTPLSEPTGSRHGGGGVYTGEWVDREQDSEFNRRALLHGRDPFLWRPVENNWGFNGNQYNQHM